MKSLGVALISLMLLTGVGCAATTDDEADSNGGAISARASSAAIVTPKDFNEATGDCTINSSEFEVSGLARKVNETINHALSQSRRELHEGGRCTTGEKVLFESVMSVTHNGKGFLSIAQGGSVALEGAAHESAILLGFNFDLRTGERLAIKDLLTSNGITQAVAACNADMKASARDVGMDDFSYEEECSSALKEQNGPATFTFSDEGIRVHPSMARSAFILEAVGATIPWSAIDRSLTSTGSAVMKSTQK